ncbi:MAG TPA: glycosyltransferase family 4 protein [Bryobacteraceae bacterium]|nr:glycosyltransferase family 4 protein [Bryobacteraceae bacterium]
MKILFTDQFAEPGGAQLCLEDVMAEAQARGWTTFLMRPGEGLPASIARYASGGKSGRDVLAFAADTIRAASAIRRLARKERVDLVYANGPRVLPAVSLSGRPHVFHLHSALATRYARAIAQHSLRNGAARIFAASEFVARPLLQMPCAPRVRVVYNGVADQTFRGRSFSPDALTVGMLGRISREKGHLDFVRAARGLAQLFPDLQFVIYGAPLFSGDAYEAEVRRVASNVGIRFAGWTDDPSKALHEIDILAVPSGPLESTPRVVIEALSAGTPVVAYPSGGIPELIRPGHTGILTAGTGSAALAQGILDLVIDRHLMRWISLNGRREWEQRFTVERFAREICDSLAEVAEASQQRNAFRARGASARRWNQARPSRNSHSGFRGAAPGA